MSVHWVLDRVEDGTLPHYRYGRAVRFDWKEIERWRAARQVNAA
jgi:predicted DNA-binding transcriptional regulator AlpA